MLQEGEGKEEKEEKLLVKEWCKFEWCKKNEWRMSSEGGMSGGGVVKEE